MLKAEPAEHTCDCCVHAKHASIRWRCKLPVDVRESAPITTPPSNSTAMIVVCIQAHKAEISTNLMIEHCSESQAILALHSCLCTQSEKKFR